MDAASTTGKADDNSTPGVLEKVGDIRMWRAFHPIHAAIVRYETETLPPNAADIQQLATFSKLNEHLRTFEDNFYQLMEWDPDGAKLITKHLVFTLLVPGGKASRARKAVDELDKQEYFDTSPCLWKASAIAGVIRPNVRFHNQKAQRMVQTVVQLLSIQKTLAADNPDWIRDEKFLRRAQGILCGLPGLGPKATAHFMRNAGLSSAEFAYPIIDVHIFKFLKVCRCKCSNYIEAEESFQRLAAVLGIPVLYLDAYVWCLYSGNWEPSTADFDNFITPEGD